MVDLYHWNQRLLTQSSPEPKFSRNYHRSSPGKFTTVLLADVFAPRKISRIPGTPVASSSPGNDLRRGYRSIEKPNFSNSLPVKGETFRLSTRKTSHGYRTTCRCQASFVHADISKAGRKFPPRGDSYNFRATKMFPRCRKTLPRLSIAPPLSRVFDLSSNTGLGKIGEKILEALFCVTDAT